VEGPGEGYIVFRRPWPGMMRTVYGDHARFQATYFSRFPGYYMSGDGARRDADGYIWITGRTSADPDQKSSEFCLFVMIFSWELSVAVKIE
jgi:acyl-coenzyme A synthetase/AMP-(fatty) acid ligase